MIRSLFYALRFMTALPLPWKENEDLTQVSRSSGMFPLVGLIISALLYGVYWSGSYIFSPLTTAFLQTLFWVLITGGLHLDGLSDTMDGLGSRQDRTRTLEIMKDSNTGVFGVLSLILQVLAKITLLYELNMIDPVLIILIPVTARWGQLISIRFYPSARKDGMGHFFKDYIRNRELVLGLATTICVYVLGGYPLMIVLLLFHGLYTVTVSRSITRKLGGLTGDVYGFICETGETVVLILILLFKGIEKLI